MSRPEEPLDLPPGLSPEMAEAYRRGYERARRRHEPTVALGRHEPTVALGRHEPTVRLGRAEPPEPAAPPTVRRLLAATDRQRPTRRTGKLAGPVGVTVASAALVAGAFVLGRAVTHDDGTADLRDVAAAETRSEDRVSRSGDRAPYSGPVSAVAITGGSATCRSGSSVDAAGNPVDYAPWRAFDSDLSTAWRCDGPASGQRLTLQVPAGTRVAEVGLVPGYAKTDPANGVDRYAENNRVTRVRWVLGEASYVQNVPDDPYDRSMRTRRIPATRTGTVTLEVLATASGSRDTTPVSEVRVAAPG